MIRPARVQDAQAISEIWAPVIRETSITFNSIEKTPQDIVQMIQTAQEDGRGFWVAAHPDPHADLVGGFVTYGQFRSGVGYAHTMEHTIVLAPQVRGAGMGKRLMRVALDHAKENGVHSMWAGVSAENPAGVSFHNRLGFQQVARLPQVGRKFDRWMDLILMQKILNAS